MTLENAIEAARQTEQKYLGVYVILKRGVLKIKIENSFTESKLILAKQAEGEPVFLTTKPVKEQHGIGIKNVEKIVEKYNGIMKVTLLDNLFCVNLILYMSKIKNEK